MRCILMILNLYLHVYLQKQNLLLSAGWTLSFRKLTEDGTCDHKSVYPRESVVRDQYTHCYAASQLCE